jgi:hypothetical protein
MKISLLFVLGSQEGGEGVVEKTIERVASLGCHTGLATDVSNCLNVKKRGRLGKKT